MKTVTMEQVIAWGPRGRDWENKTDNFTPDRIRELFADRETLTAHDIATLDIPVDDRVWALSHSEFLNTNQIDILIYDFVSRVAPMGSDEININITDEDREWRLTQILKEIDRQENRKKVFSHLARLFLAALALVAAAAVIFFTPPAVLAVALGLAVVGCLVSAFLNGGR